MPEFVDIAIARSMDEIPELAQEMFDQSRPTFQVSEDVLQAVGARPVVECLEAAVQANLDPSFAFNYAAFSSPDDRNFGPHYHAAFKRGGISLHRNLQGEGVVKAAFRGSYQDPRISELDSDGDEYIVKTPLEELRGIDGPVHIGSLATNRLTVIAEDTLLQPTRRHFYSRRSAPQQVLQATVHDFIRPEEDPYSFALLYRSYSSNLTLDTETAVNAFCA